VEEELNRRPHFACNSDATDMLTNAEQLGLRGKLIRNRGLFFSNFKILLEVAMSVRRHVLDQGLTRYP